MPPAAAVLPPVRPSTHYDEEVGVRACEDGDVHRDAHRVRLVESHPEVPLSAEQQEDEDSDVHQADTRCKPHRRRRRRYNNVIISLNNVIIFQNNVIIFQNNVIIFQNNIISFRNVIIFENNVSIFQNNVSIFQNTVIV